MTITESSSSWSFTLHYYITDTNHFTLKQYFHTFSTIAGFRRFIKWHSTLPFCSFSVSILSTFSPWWSSLSWTNLNEASQLNKCCALIFIVELCYSRLLALPYSDLRINPFCMSIHKQWLEIAGELLVIGLWAEYWVVHDMESFFMVGQTECKHLIFGINNQLKNHHK